METNHSLISEYRLSEGAVLYSTSVANILIGCPPEILKLLMIKHYPMPDTIVVPGTLYKYSSSQVCLEFPFYHFLFIQQGLAQGKKFKVLAQKSLCDKLREMLRVTLLGPSLEESMAIEKKLNLPQKLNRDKIEQVVSETGFLALKSKSGEIMSIDEMIDFIPFETGETQVLSPEYKNHPEVKIERKGADEFEVSCGKSYRCEIDIQKPLEPVYELKAVKVSKEEKTSNSVFSVRCLGTSEGFDPANPANGILMRIKGKWVLWDCPAFLRRHLDAIGIKFGDLDAIFISHVHEDHLDIAETIEEGKKTPIYTSPEIFHCMILKLMALLDCDFEEAVSHYDFHPVYANEPTELFGADFELFYSVHAIPAFGLRLSVSGKSGESHLFISGDNLSKRMIKQLAEAGVYKSNRKEEVTNFLPVTKEYDIIFTDSGGGIIHGDPQDYFENPHPVKHMHTGKPIPGLPSHQAQAKPGQRFIIHR